MVQSLAATMIRKMAWARAWRWTKVNRKEMAEDLEMAGWIGYLEKDGECEALCILAAKTAMTDAWLQWTFGKVNHEKRNREFPIFTGVEAIEQRQRTENPVEDVAIARDLIRKISDRIDGRRKNKLKAYWAGYFLCMKPGGRYRIDRDVAEKLGVTSNNSYTRVRTLRAIAGDVFEASPNRQAQASW